MITLAQIKLLGFLLSQCIVSIKPSLPWFHACEPILRVFLKSKSPKMFSRHLILLLPIKLLFFFKNVLKACKVGIISEFIFVELFMDIILCIFNQLLNCLVCNGWDPLILILLTETWWMDLGWRQPEQYVCFSINPWWQWLVNTCSECLGWFGLDCCTCCFGIGISACALQVITLLVNHCDN